MSGRTLILCAALGAAGVFAGGCATPKLASKWPTHPLEIDGAARDWTPGAENESSGFTASALNDNDYLYISISPETEAARRVLQSADKCSLTLWLNPDLNKERTLGIRIASGGQNRRAGHKNTGAAATEYDGPPDRQDSFGEPGQDEDSDTRNTPSAGPKNLTYIGFDENELARFAPGKSIEVKAGNFNRKGILEARIPLKLIADNPTELLVALIADALPASAPGNTDRGGRQGERSGGPNGNMGGGPERRGGMGGGMGGGPGGPPGGGMGMPGGGRNDGPGASTGPDSASENSTETEVWFHVTLAKATDK